MLLVTERPIADADSLAALPRSTPSLGTPESSSGARARSWYWDHVCVGRVYHPSVGFVDEWDW